MDSSLPTKGKRFSTGARACSPISFSVSDSSDPHIGKTFQIFVNNLEGKTKVRTFYWDTMHSDFSGSPWSNPDAHLSRVLELSSK